MKKIYTMYLSHITYFCKFYIISSSECEKVVLNRDIDARTETKKETVTEN